MEIGLGRRLSGLSKMKTFIHTAIAAMVIFVLINTASFFLLSDGHGVVKVYDGMSRIGWPFVMFEQGGFSYRREFHLKPAIADLAIAVCLGAIFAIGRHFFARKEPHPEQKP